MTLFVSDSALSTNPGLDGQNENESAQSQGRAGEQAAEEQNSPNVAPYNEGGGQEANKNDRHNADSEANEVEFVQLVWNATDEDDVKTVVVQPEDVPVVTSECSSVRVLAGDFCGVSATQPFTQRKIIYAYAQLDRGGEKDFAIPPAMRGMLFVIEGKLAVNGATVASKQMMILGGEDTLATTNQDADHVTRFLIAMGEPVNKPFHKLLGLGGFIIGETEEEVRSTMAELAVTAEQIKQEVPQYFPVQYL